MDVMCDLPSFIGGDLPIKRRHVPLAIQDHIFDIALSQLLDLFRVEVLSFELFAHCRVSRSIRPVTHNTMGLEQSFAR